MTSQDDHHREIEHARRAAEVSLKELWMHYFELGGTAALIELEAYLNGAMPLPLLDQLLLTHALNEQLAELGQSHRIPPPPEG